MLKIRRCRWGVKGGASRVGRRGWGVEGCKPPTSMSSPCERTLTLAGPSPLQTVHRFKCRRRPRLHPAPSSSFDYSRFFGFQSSFVIRFCSFFWFVIRHSSFSFFPERVCRPRLPSLAVRLRTGLKSSGLYFGMFDISILRFEIYLLFGICYLGFFHPFFYSTITSTALDPARLSRSRLPSATLSMVKRNS